MKITQFFLLIALLNASNVLAMDPPKILEISPQDQTKLINDLKRLRIDNFHDRFQQGIPEMLSVAEKHEQTTEFHLIYFFAGQFSKWSKRNHEISLLTFIKEYYNSCIPKTSVNGMYGCLKKLKHANTDSEAAEIFDLLMEGISRRELNNSKKGFFGKKKKNEYIPLTSSLDLEETKNKDEIFAKKFIALIYRYYYRLEELKDPPLKK